MSRLNFCIENTLVRERSENFYGNHTITRRTRGLIFFCIPSRIFRAGVKNNFSNRLMLRTGVGE